MTTRQITQTTTLAVNDVSEIRDYVYDGMTEVERDTKRIVDFFVSFFCLIIFSPLFLICYIAVKMEDGGPAIFKQERIGRFGRPFYIYKFRSMRVDAEKNGPELFKHEKDNRLTKVGRFLRIHHLDELPQLYNVFIGDMAFVGPRPERKYYIDKIISGASLMVVRHEDSFEYIPKHHFRQNLLATIFPQGKTGVRTGYVLAPVLFLRSHSS